MADLSIPTNDGQSEQTSDNLITQHIDIWTTAIERKSSAGRGSSNKFNLYGIKKLRELILELAVRGKLVPQDVNDEPASVLLERIAAEKAQLVKDKKIKKPKALPEIGEDEKPFELPVGWLLHRLVDLSCVITKGTTPTSVGFAFEESGVNFIKIENVSRGRINLSAISQYISIEANEVLKRSSLDVGDVLFSIAGTIGKTCVVVEEDLPANTNQALAIIRGTDLVFNVQFLLIQLNSFVAGKTRDKARGGAMPNVSLGDLNELIAVVPPLEEQHRIVAKVDELMSLCDALEAQTEASISAHQTLVETLLNALLLPNITQQKDSQSASLEPALNESFVESWQRVAEHFDTLFTTEASIDTLKQTILQLAVMGKLVPQDENDEPAAKLLERIAAEKAQLIADKKIKKQKPLPAITDEEKPFELPQGWEWVRFGSLVNFQAELVQPEEFLDYDQIAPDSIEKGTGKLLKRRTVRDSGVKGPNSRFYTGQILYSKIRPSLSKAVIAEFDGLCSADMYPLQSMVYSKYLLKSILSEVFLEQVRVAENRIKMPKLNIDSLSDIMLPLAPIEEQHCIVTKVDELMELCDQLKARLNDAQDTQLHLTDAIVEQAV